MIWVVLDANVLVSAAINSKGAPGQVLAAWRTENFSLLMSESILKEVDRVFRYPKLVKYHQWPDQRIRTFIDDLSHLSVLTPGETSLSVIEADPSDNRYLECGVEGEADYIVSGDRHLLELGTYQEIQIVNPRNFLERIPEM
jgi:uncharacterized protein